MDSVLKVAAQTFIGSPNRETWWRHLPRNGFFAGRIVRFERRNMKKDIHPDYHAVKVVMTDGSEYWTRSTYGADGDTLKLDIDPMTHSAWTGGGQHLVDRGGRLSRFNRKYKDFLAS